jgi:hypothetical protein
MISLVGNGKLEIQAAGAVKKRQVEQLHIGVRAVHHHVVLQIMKIGRVGFEAEAADTRVRRNWNCGQADIGANIDEDSAPLMPEIVVEKSRETRAPRFRPVIGCKHGSVVQRPLNKTKVAHDRNVTDGRAAA